MPNVNATSDCHCSDILPTSSFVVTPVFAIYLHIPLVLKLRQRLVAWLVVVCKHDLTLDGEVEVNPRENLLRSHMRNVHAEVQAGFDWISRDIDHRQE